MTEQDRPLHVRVAEALGCKTETCLHDYGPHWRCGCDPWGEAHGNPYSQRCAGEVLNYDTDWAATGPLIEKYGIRLEPARTTPYWLASTWKEDDFQRGTSGSTPLLAICNLILAIHDLKEAGKL